MSLLLNEQGSKDLDSMLSLLIININAAFDNEEFKKELFNDYDIDYIQGYVDFLYYYNQNLISKVGNLGMIQAGSSAKYFLSNGGFTNLYKQKSEQESHKSEVSKLEFEKLKLSVDKLRDEYFELDKSKAQTKKATNSAIVAAVAAALTLILSLIQWMCNKHG